MNVLILGAAGMIGRKLAERVARDGAIGGTTVDRLHLVDVVPPAVPAGATVPVETEARRPSRRRERPSGWSARVPISSSTSPRSSRARRRRTSTRATAINLDGTRSLFDAIRAAHDADGYTPRVLFASSIAVFGAPFPRHHRRRVLHDAAHELRHAEGDLRAPCWPTIRAAACSTGSAFACRPCASAPERRTRQASGFFSNILREPISGKEAVLPVSEDVRHWFTSPRAAVGFLPSRRDARHRPHRTPAQSQHARPLGHRPARRSRRWVAWWGRRR